MYRLYTLYGWNNKHPCYYLLKYHWDVLSALLCHVIMTCTHTVFQWKSGVCANCTIRTRTASWSTLYISDTIWCLVTCNFYSTPLVPKPVCNVTFFEFCVCVQVYVFVIITVATVQSGSSRKDVHMLFPEEEKIIVEETKSNGQTVVEERWERRGEGVCLWCAADSKCTNTDKLGLNRDKELLLQQIKGCSIKCQSVTYTTQTSGF